MKEQEESDISIEEEEILENKIIIYNDQVNTFEWVILSLIEICNHTPEQAEQIATTIHYNGKCDVKHGSYEELEPICLSLLNRQLSAKIE